MSANNFIEWGLALITWEVAATLPAMLYYLYRDILSLVR